eukprot:5971284-Amphidinium_carterae.2
MENQWRYLQPFAKNQGHPRARGPITSQNLPAVGYRVSNMSPNHVKPQFVHKTRSRPTGNGIEESLLEGNDVRKISSQRSK